MSKVKSYIDWKDEDGFYTCNVEFFSSMILDRVKKLTLDHEIMRGCVVNIYMRTLDKYGYYQVENGFTGVGFSIKDNYFYYEKLMCDTKRIRDLGSKLKLNLKETVINKHKNDYELDRKQERNVYSLFVNKEEYDLDLLSNSVDLLGLKDFKSF